jgi:hypothetical protein
VLELAIGTGRIALRLAARNLPGGHARRQGRTGAAAVGEAV